MVLYPPVLQSYLHLLKGFGGRKFKTGGMSVGLITIILVGLEVALCVLIIKLPSTSF